MSKILQCSNYCKNIDYLFNCDYCKFMVCNKDLGYACDLCKNIYCNKCLDSCNCNNSKLYCDCPHMVTICSR